MHTLKHTDRNLYFYVENVVLFGWSDFTKYVCKNGQPSI